MSTNKLDCLLGNAERAVAQLTAGLAVSGPFVAGKAQPAQDRVTAACRVIARLKSLKGELGHVLADLQERMEQLASAQGLSVPDDCGA